METPPIPDEVPYFKQGRHDRTDILHVQTRVRHDYSRSGKFVEVSTVALDGHNEGLCDCRIFADAGKGPAVRSFLFASIDEGGAGHNAVCNQVAAGIPFKDINPTGTKVDESS